MAREDAAKTGVYERSPADLPPGDTGSSDAVATTIEEESAANDDWLMRQARDIYSQSTTYIQTNIEQGWARNLAHFGSRHAAGSKFASKGYKRARVFRPKTRASVKNHEATTARAMFSTANLINIAPQNPQDERQVASAVVTQAVLQHRLETRMPWYLTVVGAFQDTKVYGLCVGYQYWHYRARNLPSGAREVLQDQLCCDLVKPENFRFDPAADWRDPANTSSYIIMEKELRLNQVKAMMRKNGGPWRDHSDAELVSYSSSRGKDKQTERAREGNRTTPSEQITVSGLELISLRLYVINIIGEDWVFWTVGGDLMMTDPRPLQAEYPHLRKGERPFVIGYSTVEAHKNYPESDVGQAAPIQREINAIASQRVDNVDLVLQKRYFIKRGAQTDLHSLARNIPGGAVFTNDPEKDVQVIPTQDVTGSSYREQQVLDTEMDELLGGYSAAKNAGQSRPASQGVSNQASSGASAIQDYGVQTFRETWIQPVLQQMVRLIQMYETDDKLIALAANQARLSMRFGVDDPTDAILLDDLILRVDMGGGILDPMVRVEKIGYGVEQVAKLPGMAGRIKGGPIAREIFGALGYRDETLFFMTDEEYAAHVEANPPPPSDPELKQKELDIRQEDNHLRHEREQQKLELERLAKEHDTASSERREILIQRIKFLIAQMNNKSSRDVSAAREETSRQRDIRGDQTTRDTTAASLMEQRRQAQQQAAQTSE